MKSNLQPFRWLFGGPGLHCGPNHAPKLNLDILDIFPKRNPFISVDYALYFLRFCLSFEKDFEKLQRWNLIQTV